jgi:hypothetical protein
MSCLDAKGSVFALQLLLSSASLCHRPNNDPPAPWGFFDLVAALWPWF